MTDLREAAMAGLINELCADLEGEIATRYAGTQEHAAIRRRFERDMAPVHRARKFLRDSGLENHSIQWLMDKPIKKAPTND